MVRSAMGAAAGGEDAECPLDGGGYYVVRGTETTTVSLENFALNSMILETESAEPDPPDNAAMERLLKPSDQLGWARTRLTPGCGRTLHTHTVTVNSASELERRRARRVVLDPGSRAVAVRFRGLRKGLAVPLRHLMFALGAASDLEIVHLVAGEGATQAELQRATHELYPSLVDKQYLREVDEETRKTTRVALPFAADAAGARAVLERHFLAGNRRLEAILGDEDFMADLGGAPGAAEAALRAQFLQKHLLDFVVPHHFAAPRARRSPRAGRAGRTWGAWWARCWRWRAATSRRRTRTA